MPSRTELECAASHDQQQQKPVTLTTYNGANQVVTVTKNPEGTLTRYSYDNMGRLLRTDAAVFSTDLRTSQVKYDAYGRVIAELAGEGNVALAALVNPTQAQINTVWTQYGISHTYDAAGRRTVTTDQYGYKTFYYYDQANHLRFTIRQADDNGTTYPIPVRSPNVSTMPWGSTPLPGVMPRKLSALGALAAGATESVRMTRETFRVIGRLLTRKASMRQVSGPIDNARISCEAARSGCHTLIRLMGLISLQLGIFNLLPSPILDGGHLTILAFESTIRRDLPLRAKERILEVGFYLLILLFVVVMFNDIVKILPENVYRLIFKG